MVTCSVQLWKSHISCLPFALICKNTSSREGAGDIGDSECAGLLLKLLKSRRVQEQSRQGKQVTFIPSHTAVLCGLVSPATHLEETSYKQRKPESFWENLVADLPHWTLMPAKDKPGKRPPGPIHHCCCLGPVCMSGLGTHFPGWGNHQHSFYGRICGRIAGVYSSKWGLLLPKHGVSYFKDENNPFSPLPHCFLVY